MAHKYLTVNHLPTKELIRVFSKIEIAPELQYNGTPCWIWCAYRSKRSGHGRIMWQRHGELIYRVVFAWLVNSLPRGAENGCLDHLCCRTACCNPVHLEFVTLRINTLRGNGLFARHARIIHCPLGHPYDATNTKFTAQGHRVCRTCAQAATRLHYQNNPEYYKARIVRERLRRQAKRLAANAN